MAAGFFGIAVSPAVGGIATNMMLLSVIEHTREISALRYE